MRYTGYVCSVCNCNFTETDDVVVCPECGTPHHRSCWKQINMCANSDRHGENYVWNGENTVKNENTNNDAVSGKLCPKCGLLNMNDEPNCVRCGERLYVGNGKYENQKENGGNDNMPRIEIFPTFPDSEQQSQQSYDYKNPFAEKAKSVYGDKTVDGIPVSETAEYIQKNNEKYIENFLDCEENGKKLSWNWASAIFGGFWLFYRKLTSVGILFCILLLSCQTIGGIITERYFKQYRTEEYEAYIQAEDDFYNLSEEYANGDSIDEEEILSVARKYVMSDVAKAESSVKIAVFVLSFIVMGFAGNSLYKNKVIKSIHKLRTVAVDDRTYHFVLRTNGGVSVINLLLPFVIDSLFSMLLGMF